MMYEQWLTSVQQQSDVIDIFILFTHLFRMPLFFLISGYFAYLLLEKKGIKGLIKNRISRILIPFVLFLPVVILSVNLIVLYNYKIVETPSPMLSRLLSASDGDKAQNSLRTTHLWFLYYLLFFYILAIFLYKSKIIERTSIFLKKHPLTVISCIPLILVPALIMSPLAHPTPESFMPRLWVFNFYGVFFFLGLLIYKNPQIITFAGKFAYRLLGVGVGLYLVFYFFLIDSLSMGMPFMPNQNVVITPKSIFAATLQAYIAVYLTLAILCIGKKRLNKTNKVLFYITKSSYWIYIIHLPVLFFIQFKLQKYSLNLWSNIFISSMSTILIGIITYLIFVKPSPLDRLLNGKKKNLLKPQEATLLLNKYGEVEV